MAELPHIGKHCDVDFCNRLDFLPVKCDACKGHFCVEHFTYDKHECSHSYPKNVQVPVCPLCKKPVPTPRGVSPDIQVNAHIQNNCMTQKKRIFNNKCSMVGCKKKELIPIICSCCQRNFCLGHRNEMDHDCNPPKANSTRDRAETSGPFRCMEASRMEASRVEASRVEASGNPAHMENSGGTRRRQPCGCTIQ